MSFDVDKNNRYAPKDLWDRREDTGLTKPVREKKGRAEKLAKASPSPSRTAGTPSKAPANARAAKVLLILILTVVIMILAAGFLLLQYNTRRSGPVESVSPINRIYMTALMDSLSYPKGMEFDSYEAQLIVKPYSLEIHLKGNADTTPSDYFTCSQFVLRTVKGMGSVTFIEDDTGKQYKFESP